jgi:hypothetical protein
MTAELTYFCWSCYQPSNVASGRCPSCGGSLQPADGADYTARLVWALHHPLADRRLLAARLLGQRGDRAAAEPLRRLVAEDPDPYTTAAALESLVTLTGVAESRSLLESCATQGAVPVRAVARWLLGENQADQEGRTKG